MALGTVLLTGASGLVGTWLRRTVPLGVDVVVLTHRTRLGLSGELTADLRDRSAVLAAVQRVAPSLVIHAAYAGDEASIVGATQNIVDAVEGRGIDILYVSTDAVFSGDGTLSREDSNPDPVSDYGRWKAQAEQVVIGHIERSAIVRLPLVVSVDPDDHVIAAIRHGAAHTEPTTWFDDEFRQPAAAPDLAAALWRIALLAPHDRAGPWHLPGPETLSRYQIAQRVVAALGLDASAVKAGRTPPGGNRPRYLNLDDGRARDRIDWAPAKVMRGG